MAINLWKIGGKPTSYNPLPSGWHSALIGYGDFQVRIKAKSLSNAKLYILESNGDQFKQTITLTNSINEYVYNFTNIQPTQAFYIQDQNAIGDIIIEDIQLVQKPLPKLTINGIDGFRSGKWALHANAKVIDDETLELNATAQYQDSWVSIPVKTGETYYIKLETNSDFCVLYKDKISSHVGANSLGAFTARSFTVDASYNGYISLRFGNSTTGKFTFKRPMLNLGTTPAPYEPKRGERMVLPSVKGRNLFNNLLESGDINATDGTNIAHATRYRSANFIPVKSLTQYVFNEQVRMSCYDANKNYLTTATYNAPIWTTTSTTAFVKIVVLSNTQVMLNEGTTPLPYEPYAVQLNKKPKRTQIAKQNKPAKAKQNIR